MRIRLARRDNSEERGAGFEMPNCFGFHSAVLCWPRADPERACPGFAHHSDIG
jgi:hypothetical protein